MEFQIEDADVLRLLMRFCKERGIYETLSALQLESGLSDSTICDELLYVQKLVLQGRWDETSSFLQPFKERRNLTTQIDFIIMRQKFLESLSYQGGGGQRIAFPPWKPDTAVKDVKREETIEKEVIFKQLIALQSLCSIDEFNSLCQCLSLDKLEDHPNYTTWTVAQGRIQCFSDLRTLLAPLLPGNEPEPQPLSSSSGGLLKMIAMGTAYQVSHPSVATNKTLFSNKLGYIVPHSSNHNSHVPVPTVVLTNPVPILKRFDMVMNRVPTTNTHAAAQSKISFEESRPSSARSRPGTANNTGYIAQPTAPPAAENVFNFSGNVTTKWPQHVPDARESHNNNGAEYEHKGEAHGSAAAVQKRAPVAWVADEDMLQQAAQTITANKEHSIKEHKERVSGEKQSASVAAAALVTDETPAVKPMPAALRRKMQQQEEKEREDREALTAAQQERERHQQQLQQAQSNSRPVSRGRGSSRDVADQPPLLPAQYNYARPAVAEPEEEERLPRRHSSANRGSSSSVHSGSTSGKSSRAAPEKQQQQQQQLPPPQLKSDDGNSRAKDTNNPFPNIKASVFGIDHGEQGGSSKPKEMRPAAAPAAPSQSGSVVSGSTAGGSKAKSAHSHLPQKVSPKAPSSQHMGVYMLYHTAAHTPIRCVNFLHNLTSSIAIGTNDKSLLVLRFDRPGIAKEFRTVPSGTLCDASAYTETQTTVSNVHKGSVYAMDYCANYGVLVSGSNDKLLKITRAESGEIINTLKGHNGTIRSVRFQPLAAEGEAQEVLIASAGGGDNAPRIWDLTSGDCLHVLQAHPNAVHGVVWLCDHILLTGCESGILMGHDVRTGESAWNFNLSSKVRRREQDLRLEVSAQDADCKRGVCCLALLDNSPAALAANSAGNKAIPVIAGCESGFLTIFDAYTGRILFNKRLHKEDIRSVCVSSSGKSVLTSSYDGTAALWRIEWNSRENVFELVSTAQLQGGHVDKVLDAVMVPRSTDVITSGADGRVMLWTTQ